MYTEPSIWPSTIRGDSALPQSWAAHTAITCASPVATSTSTSATWAVNEYAGDAPIVPPR